MAVTSSSGVLEHIAGRPGLQRGHEAGLIAKHGEYQQFGVRMFDGEPVQQILTPPIGQAKIDQKHIGVGMQRVFQRVAAAHRHANQLPLWPGQQGLPDEVLDGGIVFDQVNARFIVHLCGLLRPSRCGVHA